MELAEGEASIHPPIVYCMRVERIKLEHAVVIIDGL